jgi:hypothetical protein
MYTGRLQTVLYMSLRTVCLSVLVFWLAASCAAQNRCTCVHSPLRVSNGCNLPSNGCGSLSTARMVPELSFHECCNQHDLCYTVCNGDKERCDADFYRCMFRSCLDEESQHHRVCQHMSGTAARLCAKEAAAKRSLCNKFARFYYFSVSEVGCRAWVATQNACCTVPCK